jgi:hypothetical protein
MSYHDLFVMIIVGALFLVLGIFGLFWSRKEYGEYIGGLSSQSDVREYLDRLPVRPEPVAIKYGGRISIVVGLGVLLVTLVLYLLGIVK